MNDLPPGLKEFGERLEQAAARDVEKRRRATMPLRRRRLRNIGLPVLAGLVAGAVSAGAVKVVDRGGEPIAPDPGALVAPKDPAVILATATDDPGGGPPWVMRAYADARGRECVQVGRLLRGDFGQIQRGRFRALPASAPATCDAVGDPRPLPAVVRRGTVNLTLVFGLADDRATRVTVRVGDRSQRVRPAGFGAFLTIFEGADPRTPIFVRSTVDGRTTEERLR